MLTCISYSTSCQSLWTSCSTTLEQLITVGARSREPHKGENVRSIPYTAFGLDPGERARLRIEHAFLLLVHPNDAVGPRIPFPSRLLGHRLACLSRLEAWLRRLWVAMMS
jgi:hypothetical protein